MKEPKMRTFKSFTKEDVKEPVQPWDPRSEGEQRFKHLHNPINHKDLVPGVTDQDHVFNGGTRKYDPPTASYEKGTDAKAYDKTLTREEIEQVDEILDTPIKKLGYIAKNAYQVATADPAKMANDPKKANAIANRVIGAKRLVKKLNKEEVVLEKHLTPAEMKKREVIAKAMGRENPKMDMAKKMAIATAQAKKSEKMKAYRSDRDKNMEEKVQIDELSKATLGSYIKKASHDVATKSAATARYAERSQKEVEHRKKTGDYSGYRQGREDDKTADKMFGKSWKRRQGIAKAVDKLTKESNELEEAKRGRPRKNPLPTGSSNAGEEEGGREHIIVQYRKAERMPEKEIEHNDNSKHSFPKAHYKKALDMHLTMKPSEKETFEKRLAASKASALSAVAGEPAPKAKPKITLGGKMQKEAKDLDTKNVKAAVKHDCATHVKHGKFGEGRCVPEMHTIKEISEGFGYVTHYDVLFEHGIEKDVPVGSLQILASEEHGHTSKKTMREALIGNQHKIDANHNNKIDKQDFKILKGKEKFKKFSKIKESSEANMQQDSLDRLKSDPLAGTELKKKTKLPPTQGNTPVGGDQNPTRVAGKYSMEEESLNNLYNSLSEENQAKFDEMIETDPGFEQLLDFARKQGF